ncbi:thiamine-phosphate kinase [bacterium]|nr:thiamine-phosphate kinase [bacterium]
MKISELGGEFKLIERLTRKSDDPNIIVDVGDDAAVIRMGEKYLLLTTDMLCEGDHFSLDYFTPRQIGIKAMVSNQSDIAAMGGTPLYALVSLALTENTNVETIEGIYEGMYFACREYGGSIIGGDTTHSNQVIISLTLIGEVERSRLVTRAGAKPGDLIYVSGQLGGSTAGLNLHRQDIKGFDRVKLMHTEPFPRFDISAQVSASATAMEDVSDGLASEIRNICEASKTGALIYADKVPIEAEVSDAAAKLGQSALDYALYGGEDFELVYTVPPNLKGKVPGYLVGEITKKKGIILIEGEARSQLTRFGYDHFRE